MPLPLWFFTYVNPPVCTSGMRFSTWWRLLRDNSFRVQPRFWMRAGATTLASVGNSVAAWHEERKFGAAIKRQSIEPPTFVLGHWRSGTTYLHNLLAQDARFGWPTSWQVFAPEMFITTEKFLPRLWGPLLPTKRPMDNMTARLDEPQEDEFAILTMNALSHYTGWIFPRRETEYAKYLTFDDATAEEREAWKDALRSFVRKLSYRYAGRPILLKSPPHTARLRMILDVFPDARFIFIHRHPYDVFRSTRHTMRMLEPWFTLQAYDRSLMDGMIIDRYAELHDAYLDQRDAVPAGQLHEIRYDDLVRLPIRALSQAYAALDLPAFSETEMAIRSYLFSLGNYQVNRFNDLDDAIRARLDEAWARMFEAFDYARGPREEAVQ